MNYRNTCTRGAVLALMLMGLSACDGGSSGPGNTAGPAPVPPPEAAVLSDAERADLLFTREEEKLARDVYRQAHARWAVSVFDNIASAESQHMAQALDVLLAFGLSDPVVDENVVGLFSDPELTRLYAELDARTAQSLPEALRAGAWVEEVDILDIRAAAYATENSTLDALYAALECGSRNHLRAFAAQWSGMTGTDYAPQLMTAADVAAILNTPQERCGARP